MKFEEDIILKAIFAAHKLNGEIISFFEEIVRDCGKEKHSYESSEVNKDLYQDIVDSHYS